MSELIDRVEFLGLPNVKAATGIQSAVLSLNSTAARMAKMPCRVANDPAMCDCGTKPVYGGESTLDIQQIVAAAQGGWVYAFRSG